MKHFIFLLCLALLSSCASTTQEAEVKYFGSKSLKASEAELLNHAPFEIVVVQLDPGAPTTTVTDKILTDPCETVTVKNITVKDYDREVNSPTIECSELLGPWNATFSTLHGTSVPTLLRPGTIVSGDLALILLNVYLRPGDAPIKMLVDL